MCDHIDQLAKLEPDWENFDAFSREVNRLERECWRDCYGYTEEELDDLLLVVIR